jgi:hypothetical protein
LADLTLSANRSAMSRNHTFDRRQTDPTAGEFAFGVQPAKRRKKLTDVSLVEAHTVVFDHKGN